MDGNFLALLQRGKALNSKVFSLVRLELLSSLSALGHDGATYRELKAALSLTDGALFTNLKALESAGYASKQEVTVEGKKLDSYRITPEGKAEWEKVRQWLNELTGGDGNG
ncbi:transcriptional regulator [Candidatus Micrarchaeota archaeon]|nr:transcriptional regulator [Candidatus Micrarchaeota archaeon]MBI5177336.1 transcriptional regulator [Candidatus Micrarchaeota archaeon]